MRTPAGFFCLMNNQSIFEKPPLPIQEQLKLLSSRGLVIQDKQIAEHYLKFISYYRFCGYGIEFEDLSIDGEKQYLPGTTFEQILDCYVFDRKLRLLVIDAIERIEIAIRTVITNQLAATHGAHWYLDKTVFVEKFNHDELIQSIEKETHYEAIDGTVQHNRREPFLQHYFRKYSEPKLPAVWMVAEILSLGKWSMIFANIADRENQKLICQNFGISHSVMKSWLHSLTYLRNLCAHHSKLWSRSFTLKPMVANDYREQLENNSHFAAQAAILKILLDVISPDSNWADHLNNLINQHSEIDPKRMGFKEDWFLDSFWSA
jgi:abortive infection bacteriophage resistance protein